MGRLDGKVALVTGGNSGIGEATAKLFAKEGATVLITARRESELKRVADEITAAGGVCTYAAGDVTSTPDVDRVVDTTVERYGRVDILVNNAGMADKHIATIRMTDDFWDKIFDVDMKSVMRFARACLRYMEPAKSGSIVNVASIGGTYSVAGAAYSSAKAGVISLTRNLAIQYFGSGIRANCISPGATKTPLFSPENMEGSDMEMLEATRSRPHKNNLGPIPAEAQAYAILFLASDESQYINGQNIVVDGGGCL